MYAQFRSQYPMGSLISELLNIHEGKYIVRASIQVGGSTLATGLSAATSIEQAEDQARVRALVVLGIDDRPYSTHAQIVNAESEGSAVRGRTRLASPAHTGEFLPLAEASFQQSVDVDWAMADQAARAFQEPEHQLSWFDRSSADPTPAQPQLSGRALGQEMLFPQAAVPARPSYPPPRTEGEGSSGGSSHSGRERPEAPVTISAPVDLSDIIAHTDVELKRLGWTNIQGRRHLEQTYGKRSRQHLSDTELTEFLDYLKAQPAPTKSVR